MNILMIVVDCLRADRLGNDRKSLTPNLQKLTSRGALFSQAVTSCVTTTPSFASFLTGRYPPAHGVFSLKGYRLSKECPTLVESLREAGYYTFAAVTGPLLELVGLNSGFTSYHCRQKEEHLSGAWGKQLISKLRSGILPEPWFGLIHLWELHAPMFIPEGFNQAKYGRCRYDRALAALDEALAELLDAVPPETLIVLMGDHGESLSLEEMRPFARAWQGLLQRLSGVAEPDLAQTNGDSGGDQRTGWPGFARRLLSRFAKPWQPSSRYQMYRRWQYGHGWHVYDELVRVPLLFTGPGFPSRVIPEQVRTVDILPTLLDCVGVRPREDGRPIHGKSILPLLEGPEPTPRPAYLEAAGSCLPDQSFWLRGIRTPAYKYMHTPFAQQPVAELYDLRRDPGETRNIVDDCPEVAGELRSLCDAIALPPQSVPPHEEHEMSAEEEAVLDERLRQLGYLE
jgi:arylsulfatase A-like enzyme